MFITDFVDVVCKFPERTAAYYKNIQITYGEIDAMSSLVASFLQQRNFGRGSVIGYHGGRKIELLISILGIWKAGAIYMPIDLILPYERKKIMCEQSETQLLLTDGSESKLDFINCISVAEIVKKCPETLEFDGEEVVPIGEDVAYIIFTSGTTGIPKGAMITQAGMYNHLLGKKKFLNFTDGMVLAQTANIGFDISVWQLVLPLMFGGPVCFVKDSDIMNYKKLTNYIRIKKVQILEIVPSYLEHWLMYLQGKKIDLPSLKYLFVTGEVFSPKLANVCLQFFKTAKIVNAYGPAEAADDVTHYVLDNNVIYDNVPLGYSIDGMRVDILDEQDKAVPVGEKGFIYVTGVGVGQGYINDTEKTAHSFKTGIIVPGERSYNTGDMGYMEKDGLLYFCGRKNNQVKIRGHRMELEEIETRLQNIQCICEAVVAVKDDSLAGVAGMTAYIRVLDCDTIPNKQYLQKELRKFLPYYMIPKAYYVCNIFPVSENGKIDRKNVYKHVKFKID